MMDFRHIQRRSSQLRKRRFWRFSTLLQATRLRLALLLEETAQLSRFARQATTKESIRCWRMHDSERPGILVRNHPPLSQQMLHSRVLVPNNSNLQVKRALDNPTSLQGTQDLWRIRSNLVQCDQEVDHQ